MKNKKAQKQIRHKRVTKKFPANDVPRLVIFRSNKFMYAQLVDDMNSKTLIASSDIKIKSEKKSKMETAKEVGLTLARNALKKNIKKVIFDRAGYKYHGRVKAVAQGAREGGLVF